jgi:hypothetical protein
MMIWSSRHHHQPHFPTNRPRQGRTSRLYLDVYKTNVSPILRIPFRRRSCTRRTVVSPRRREDPSADTKTNHLIPKNRIHHTQRPTPRDTCRFSTVVVRLTCNQKVSSSILEVVSSLSHIPNERERLVLTHHTHYRADKEFPPLHFCISYVSLNVSFSNAISI